MARKKKEVEQKTEETTTMENTAKEGTSHSEEMGAQRTKLLKDKLELAKLVLVAAEALAQEYELQFNLSRWYNRRRLRNRWTKAVMMKHTAAGMVYYAEKALNEAK